MKNLTERNRIPSLDIVRGIVMLLMTLDHSRDFFGDHDIPALDLDKTNGFLFFSRWITHFCAPTFVFLAGVSIFLQKEKKNLVTLSRFLLTRGLMLILLEQTFLRCLGWYFNVDYRYMNANVLWGIGGSMILLSILIYLPDLAVLVLGVFIVVFDNLILELFPFAEGQKGYWFWTMFFQGGNIEYLPEHNFYVSYPFIPWLGVMALGYGLGIYFLKPHKLKLYHLGLAFLGIFILFRVFIGYGDPNPWQTGKSPLFSFLSFINLEKYPPSFLFSMLTLSFTLLFLSIAEKLPAKLQTFLSVYGRVPLFFYVFHIIFIHLLALILALIRYGRAEWLYQGPSIFWFETLPGHPADYGLNLIWVYLIALFIGLVLYPLCKAYASLKAKIKWLRYF